MARRSSNVGAVDEEMNEPFDVVIIGGGQAGLAMGYYLRQQGLRFVTSSEATRSRPPGASAGTRSSSSRPAATAPCLGFPSPASRTTTQPATR